MTRESYLEGLHDRLTAAAADPTLQNNWAQLRSKHLLSAVAPTSISSINYTYSTEQLVRRTTSILQRALRLSESGTLHRAPDPGLRRAAEIFEYLADLDEGPNRHTSALISATLYQLAGYAANSACLARALNLPSLPLSIERNTADQLLGRGVALVLQRRFVRLQKESADVAAWLRRSEDRFVAQLTASESPVEDAAGLAIALLAAAALGALARYVLRGQAFIGFLVLLR